MRQSNFTDEMKRKIILEHIREKVTVRELSAKHKITPNTFYLWKKALSESTDFIAEEKLGNNQKELIDIDEENKTLRRLYINLSAHNYELAKFLEK